MNQPKPDIAGVLLIDKPKGLTSHDVVAQLRRRLRTKRVGHAGTLDPMATGLLVGLVGEATKLEPWLSGSSKAYAATILFGRATTTLDAEGETTIEAPVSEAIQSELLALADSLEADAPLIRGALDLELSRTMQSPPSFSAIKVDGVRSYARARAGEEVVLADRPVKVHRIDITRGSPQSLEISVELEVSKGYYVRSFARDLGDALGCPTHLTALRRTRSGGFDLSRAVALQAATETELIARLIPLATAAASHLESLRVDAACEAAVRQGKSVVLPAACVATAGTLIALLDETHGRLIAVVRVVEAGREPSAEVSELRLEVVRGFNDVQGGRLPDLDALK